MDEDLKLVDQLLFEATAGHMTSVTRDVMAEAAATITRLRAEITQMTNTIDGLEFQLNQARAEIERLKSNAAAVMPPCG
jgi:chromosome segregation ATPase